MDQHIMQIDGIEYKILYDKYTGDWSVYSDQDAQIQGDWFLTKEGAVNYVLNSNGIVENDRYQRAPDRC